MEYNFRKEITGVVDWLNSFVADSITIVSLVQLVGVTVSQWLSVSVNLMLL